MNSATYNLFSGEHAIIYVNPAGIRSTIHRVVGEASQYESDFAILNSWHEDAMKLRVVEGEAPVSAKRYASIEFIGEIALEEDAFFGSPGVPFLRITAEERTTINIVKDSPEQRTLYLGPSKMSPTQYSHEWEVNTAVSICLENEAGDEGTAVLRVKEQLGDGTALMALEKVTMPDDAILTPDDYGCKQYRIISTYPDGPWYSSKAGVSTYSMAHPISDATAMDICSPIALTYELSLEFLGE